MRSSLLASKFRSGVVLMAAALAAMTISGCAGRERPRLAYEERPVEALYNTGYERLQQHRWSDAVDYFQEVERQHPYSDWARRSILMQVYAYYQNNNYADAIAAADRFIQLFPGNPSAAYAFYMRAVCNFEQITDVGRDQGYANAALTGLRDVARRYPGTPYATDAAAQTIYAQRMTYGFGRVSSPTHPMVVPRQAVELIAGAYPQLTDEQRRQVLEQTASPAGYPLDDQRPGRASWQRLDLVRAYTADVTVGRDGRVTVH